MKYFLLLLVCGLNLRAQLTFQKTYGGPYLESAYSMAKTNDGGYITAGYSATYGAGARDIYVVKTDSAGVMQWNKTYGTSGWQEANSIVQTSDGGYAITGYTEINPNNQDVFLLKINSAGTLQWLKTYGDSIYENGLFLQQSADKGFIITGSTTLSGPSATHIYVIKTDSVGALQWTRVITGGGCCGYSDRGRMIRQIQDGSYILLGSTWFFGNSQNVMYLAKLSPAGTVLWNVFYFYTAGNGYAEGFAFEETADKGFIITGDTGGDGFLLKTDSSGTALWANTYGWPGTDDAGQYVITTQDGGYLITGNKFITGGTIIKTTSNGTLQWAKAFGDTTTFTSNITVSFQTPDKGYIVCGEKDSLGQSDVYLVKTDSMGVTGCDQVTLFPVVAPLTFMSFGSVTQDSGGIANTFTVAVGSGGYEYINCFFPVDVKEEREVVFSVFPNPTSKEINVRSDVFFENATFCVLNSLGEEVKQFFYKKGNSFTIPCNDIRPGIYFLQIRSGSAVFIRKISIE